MKLKKFYKSKVDEKIIKVLDINYKKNLDKLVRSVNKGEWTKAQKKKQNKSILPKVALYKTFMEFGFNKEESKELVRDFIYSDAKKANKLLSRLFLIPKFQRFFRMIMRKGMKGDEIWNSEILKDNDKYFAINIRKCLWKDTCDYFRCPELCEIFCESDYIVFGNNKKMEFHRENTLGTRGDECDFKFIFK